MSTSAARIGAVILLKELTEFGRSRFIVVTMGGLPGHLPRRPSRASAIRVAQQLGGLASLPPAA